MCPSSQKSTPAARKFTPVARPEPKRPEPKANRGADNRRQSGKLTVTRALIDEGMPSSQVFAAAFGAEQPVAPNADERGRAQNRRVEMAPVPKTAPTPAPTLAASQAQAPSLTPQAARATESDAP